MKFSEQWLRTWVDPKINRQTLLAQLTLAGLEVANAEAVAGNFSKVVVGHVIEASAHPQADRLKLCRVDIGAGDPLNIVCGADNVCKNLRVAVAVVGAQLPGDMTIKAATLKGEVSQGMLCSAKELGLGDEAGKIIELPMDLPVGEDLYQYLQLDDHSIHIDLTPNRADCLSILGIAREVAALNQCDLKATPNEVAKITCKQQMPVEISAPQACSQYIGRIIRGVNLQATTPIWMQERLRRSGLRAIHPVVDVTNYVMLEIGQPMHAFDYNKLHGKIIVRYPKAGESLQLLDDKTVSINEDTLVIADEKQVLALAGVMGGAASAVDDETRDIFLESAYFTPQAIAGQARAYGLSTDSSHRFERGVDPALQLLAIERATVLLQSICGGEVGAISTVKGETHLQQTTTIKLRSERIRKVLGLEISVAKSILQRLGMTVTEQNNSWQVAVPSYRF
ncbi:MAG: phenylalanine--tRNA ligase subunit beta, partial [Gammaproteobacteria bacterium]